MNTAERIIKPTEAGIFRTIFLYTGQGESTLMVIPTGPGVDDYKYVLIDSDKDNEKYEIDLVALFKDLFATKGSLEVFINTHPHNDHIGGIKEVYDQTKLKEVWHSNHKPGGQHKDKYKGLQDVIKAVGKENEYFLNGTNELNTIRTSADEKVNKKLGNIDFQVLSPAKYLCDDIAADDPDDRYKRIHEQCGVIRFSYAGKSILITGDSDKEAWQEHITDYYKNQLPSTVLSASHHGSRTFFKDNEDDEDVYETHIETIKPTYLIISAPRQEDSPHDHPHDDAIELYEKHIKKANILHLGKNYESIIVDIKTDGTLSVTPDKELVTTYGTEVEDQGGDNSQNESKAPYIVPSTTRIDNKPSGSHASLV